MKVKVVNVLDVVKVASNALITNAQCASQRYTLQPLKNVYGNVQKECMETGIWEPVKDVLSDAPPVNLLHIVVLANPNIKWIQVFAENVKLIIVRCVLMICAPNVRISCSLVLQDSVYLIVNMDNSVISSLGRAINAETVVKYVTPWKNVLTVVKASK